MAYPLEARLRPAHELGAACVSALGAAMVLSSPGLFLVTPPWHFALAGALRLASGTAPKVAGSFAVRPRWPLADISA